VPASGPSGGAKAGPGPRVRPTLAEVADHAGVSPSTVSRVVRGSTPVSSELERVVRDAIEATGYVPNLAARQLVTSRSDTVGVVIPEDQMRVFGEPFFAEMIQGVAAHLATTPFRFILVVGRSTDDRDWLLHYVGGRHVDGVMLISPGQQDPLGQAMERSGVPVVFMGKPFHASRQTRYVDADNIGGVERAVAYLHEQGRRRIAMVAGIRAMRSSIDRTTGYRRGLEKVQLPVDDELVVHSDYTDVGGEQAMTDLLARHRDIDAVVAASDLAAVGVLRALRLADIKVPDDIAVVGFGNDRIAERTEPPLTTVAQPAVRMGSELARLMVAAIAGSTRPKRIVMPTELIVRETA
jgi:DNA-binding LacI/PurR family transcriptional regulator